MDKLKLQLTQINTQNTGLTSNNKTQTDRYNSLNEQKLSLNKQKDKLTTQLKSPMSNKIKLNTQLSNENTLFKDINTKYQRSITYQNNLKKMKNIIDETNENSGNLHLSKDINTSLHRTLQKYDDSLNPNLDILNIRKRMLFIGKERNKYKKKIIYTQVAILLLLILFIVGLYNINNNK